MTKKYGIYAICLDDDDTILYVGYTMSSFFDRFWRHQQAVFDEKNRRPLYEDIRQYLQEGCRVYARPLVSMQDLSLSYKQKLTEHDIQCMELALISYLRPPLNLKGVDTNYSFDDSRERQFVCNRWSDSWSKPLLKTHGHFDFELEPQSLKFDFLKNL